MRIFKPTERGRAENYRHDIHFITKFETQRYSANVIVWVNTPTLSALLKERVMDGLYVEIGFKRYKTLCK